MLEDTESNNIENILQFRVILRTVPFAQNSHKPKFVVFLLLFFVVGILFLVCHTAAASVAATAAVVVSVVSLFSRFCVSSYHKTILNKKTWLVFIFRRLTRLHAEIQFGLIISRGVTCKKIIKIVETNLFVSI